MDATQITQNIITQLRLLDPAVSAEVGTPERKIIESVAEVIASATVDFSVLNQKHDLEAMTGARLDAYLGNFGFGRQQAIPATGFVTFLRDQPATEAITIPRGTQVKANVNDSAFPDILFITTSTVVLPVGESQIDAPIMATIPGTIGNVEANTITSFGGLQSVSGITSLTNEDPTSGGVDGEDDTQYKIRFKNSLFRNMAGTYDNFLALALSQAAVTKANVIGPVSRYQEYVQVPSVNDVAQRTRVRASDGTYSNGGYDNNAAGSENWKNKRTTALSSVPYSKYAYQQQYYLTDGNLDPATAKFYRPFVDFVFNAPPVIGTHAAFAINTTYEVDQYIQMTATDANARIYKVTTAGTTSGTAPGSWPTTGTVINGSVTFTHVGLATLQVQDVSATNIVKPNVTILGRGTTGSPVWPAGLEPGATALLEHAYISRSSRNNYDLGILNCVDIFVNGGKPKTVSSVHVVPSTSNKLQNTDAGVWTYQLTGQSPSTNNVINFRRKLDGRHAKVGNIIQPLFWQPALSVPNTITIGSNTYYRANYYNSADSTYYNQKSGDTYSLKAHYCHVVEVNGNHGSFRARNGIEWFGTGNPNNYLNGKKAGDSGSTYTGKKIDDSSIEGTQFTAKNYTYDENVSTLQAIMERNKQVTTDVLVHRSKERYFKVYVTIMYTPGSTKSVVDAAINAALANFYNNQYFGSAIQLSDILQTIHNVPGVDNVRWTADQTNPPFTYKVEEVNSDGTSLYEATRYFYNDFFIQDNELAAAPSASAAVIRVRAQNTWTT